MYENITLGAAYAARALRALGRVALPRAWDDPWEDRETFQI